MSNQLFNSKGFCFLLPLSTGAKTGAILLDQGYLITIQLGADIYIQKTLDSSFCVSHFGKQLVQITIVAVSPLDLPEKGCATVGLRLDKLYTDYIAKLSVSLNKYTIVYDNVTYQGLIIHMTKENSRIPGIVQYIFEFVGLRT